MKSMGIKVMIMLALCFTLVNTATNAEAAFEMVNLGARTSGLAGAFTGIADDVNAIYHNPAGLVNIPRMELGTSYGRLYVGLDDDSGVGNSFIGYAYPIRLGGKLQADDSTLVDYKDLGTLGFGWLNLTATGLYFENIGIISYAKGNFHEKIKGLSLGMNFKVINIGYGSDPKGYTDNAVDNSGMVTGLPDALFTAGKMKTDFTLDLGMFYKLGLNYMFGMAITNLTEPNLALGVDQQYLLRREYKIGVAYKAQMSLLGLDFVLQQYNSGMDYKVLAAGEMWLPFGLGFRGGAGIGARNYASLSAGLGYRTTVMQFDYALVYPLMGISDQFGTHKVSLTMRFGPMVNVDASTEELRLKLNKETQARQVAEKAAETARFEAEKAKQEVAGLRKELDELLKKKIPAAPVVSKPVEIIPEKPVVTPQKPVTPAVAAVSEEDEMRKEFDVSMSYYRKQTVSGSMSLKDRIAMIEKILDKYSGKKIVLTEAKDELALLKTEQEKIVKDFNASWRYYQKLVERNIGTAERVSLLNRMVDKYEQQGINIAVVKEELGKLKK